MERRLCIYAENGVGSGWIDGDVAAKMLEVYDKSKEFQPIMIDINTAVSVGKTLTAYPVRVTVNDTMRRYSLDESLAFAEALVNAVKHVKNFA